LFLDSRFRGNDNGKKREWQNRKKREWQWGKNCNGNGEKTAMAIEKSRITTKKWNNKKKTKMTIEKSGMTMKRRMAAKTGATIRESQR